MPRNVKVRKAWLGAFVAVLALMARAPVVAAPADAQQITAHLSAGEFGPALKLARQSSDVVERDQWLSQIAAAQRQAGAGRAALETLAEIRDDRLRYSVLNEPAASRPSSFGPLSAPPAALGGGEAGLDSLIQLITETVAPLTWIEAGGTGSISSFPGGVYVDAAGVLRKVAVEERDGALAKVRGAAARLSSRQDVRRDVSLRKVSLPRLEKYIQLRLAAGQPLPDDALVLAGLQRIRYVLVYPEQGEIVLAGPAGAWEGGAEGRVVSQKTGRPVLRLDDLVVVLRHALGPDGGRFGCSITPTQESLAETQAFLTESSQTPLKPRGAKAWLDQLRAKLGRQQIDIFGIDPHTRVGRVIVEADYHMKLVGLGLAESVAGVPSYFDSIRVPPGQAPEPLDVLRWWFTLDYDAVRTTAPRDAFELRGQGAKVLSETELLTELGERVHTGQAKTLNAEFAANFTQHFPDLVVKYPLYAELQNIFDLALVSALLKSERLPEKCGWHMAYLLDPAGYQVERGQAPATVETVIAHRIVNKKHILAAVSGGVTVEPEALVRPEAIEIDDYGLLRAEQAAGLPADLPRDAWWWD